VAACYRFGVFLGNRYRDFPNIIWAFGNDYDEEAWSVTPTDVAVMAVAHGILSQDKNHLVTLELGGPLGTKQSCDEVLCPLRAQRFHPVSRLQGRCN
jgi:Protein of unknown function (DUF4038)